MQPVDCLWICDQGFAVAVSAPNKPTYLFTQLASTESAATVLEFGDRYHHSKTSDVPWKQFPEALKAGSVAKIPAVQ